METSDYVILFSQNLVIISFIGLVILVIWIGLAVKDCIGSQQKYKHRKCCRTKHEPAANNAALRFFYEFFFEMCLVSLIQIGTRDMSSFSPAIQWVTAVIVLSALGLYILWIISLFFHGGPFLRGFYNKGTYFASFWAARPFDTNFNAVGKLELQEAR